MKKYLPLNDYQIKLLKVFILILLSVLLPSCKDKTVSPKEEDYLSNYFPLKVGNRWTFKFAYYPFGGSEYYNKQEGTLNWTIIKNGITDKEFIIQEIAKGKKYSSHDNGNTIIANDFGPDTLETKFEIAEDIWVKIKLSFFKLESGSVMIKTYYPYNWSDTLNLHNHDGLNTYEDQIKGDWNFYNITLQKNVGIIYGGYGGESNGAPSLYLDLETSEKLIDINKRFKYHWQKKRKKKCAAIKSIT